MELTVEIISCSRDIMSSGEAQPLSFTMTSGCFSYTFAPPFSTPRKPQLSMSQAASNYNENNSLSPFIKEPKG